VSLINFGYSSNVIVLNFFHILHFINNHVILFYKVNNLFSIIVFYMFYYTKQLPQTLKPGKDKKDDGATNSIFSNDFWICTCL